MSTQQQWGGYFVYGAARFHFILHHEQMLQAFYVEPPVGGGMQRWWIFQNTCRRGYPTIVIFENEDN